VPPRDDDGDHAVVYFAEPIRSAYVLIPRARLAGVTSLRQERWKRAHPSSAGRWASGGPPPARRTVEVDW